MKTPYVQGMWPVLPKIAGLSAAKLRREMAQINRDLNEQWEADRRAARRAREMDPNRCHCPHCTVIGA